MPLYTYRCELCGITEDIALRLAEYTPTVPCRRLDCDGTMVRVPTAANFTVKGFNAANRYGVKGEK